MRVAVGAHVRVAVGAHVRVAVGAHVRVQTNGSLYWIPMPTDTHQP